MYQLYSQATATLRSLATASGSLISYYAPVPSDPAGERSELTPAERQFHTSSSFPLPASSTFEPWKIRNDYPLQPPPDPCSSTNAPWLQVDFTKEPETYANVIRSYCFDGMVQNDFNAHKCTTRDWYHAPWLHYGPTGREPLQGLTSERPIPPYELARSQKSFVQFWACGYYNATAASVYGQMWRDPNKPNWVRDVQFPEGSLTFKVLMSNASDEDLPTQKGSPTWPAVICPDNPQRDQPPIAGSRNNFASDVRLTGIDFAVRDARAPIGWVFGTFLYDGRKVESNPWYRTIPIGIQWGNDPQLTQKRYEMGEAVKESWINPAAEELRLHLGGFRPFWGWNGRLNGAVDKFMSACASCHSTASRYGDMYRTQLRPTQDADGRWKPASANEMLWFQNTPSGTPIQKGAVTADYSLQLELGFKNFERWRESNEFGCSLGGALTAAVGPRRVKVPAFAPKSSKRDPLESFQR
ncbi:hypothetical protein FRC06_005692 [Ceratobasidium sp. 370]|nr:hypothetical protein FRC06_005692 [Ceratobasidium sp. 370]